MKKVGVAQECSDERAELLADFQYKVYGRLDGQEIFDAPKMCVDTSSLEIQGEPNTRTEASVIIALETRPEIQALAKEVDDCAFNYEMVRMFCES